jgi:hypothetical protein
MEPSPADSSARRGAPTVGGGSRREARQKAAEADVLERMKGRGQPIPGLPAASQASVNRTADHHALTMETIRRATQTSERTNETGASTLIDLGRQREQLEHANETVDLTLENLRLGRVTIRDIKRAMLKEKFIKGAVIAGLLLIIFVIIYLKFMRKH